MPNYRYAFFKDGKTEAEMFVMSCLGQLFSQGCSPSPQCSPPVFPAGDSFAAVVG